MGLPLKPIKVHLDDIPSLKCIINYTTHLGVIHNLAEDALNSTVCVINKYVGLYWSP